MSRSLPRDVHPGAWWLWAIGLAAAASLTTNPYLLVLIVGVAAVVVVLRRTDHPWSRSFKFYLILGAVSVVLRVLFRMVFGGGFPGSVVLDLPTIELPGAGINLLGPVTREALVAGLYDGLRLAAILICVGAANSLANPKRLLRSMPAALYEIGTAMVVAVTVLPQFTQSIGRVRAAQQLRAGETRRFRGLRRILVPVLEDTFAQSLALAAGMDARGYGRSGEASRTQRRVTGGLMIGGLLALCVGVYAFLDYSAPRELGVPMMVLGVVLGSVGFRLSGRQVARTVYRPDPWRTPEWGVAASGVAVGVMVWVVNQTQVAIAYPDLDRAPELSVLALAGVCAGLLAVVVSPEPKLGGSR